MKATGAISVFLVIQPVRVISLTDGHASDSTELAVSDTTAFVVLLNKNGFRDHVSHSKVLEKCCFANTSFSCYDGAFLLKGSSAVRISFTPEYHKS